MIYCLRYTMGRLRGRNISTSVDAIDGVQGIPGFLTCNTIATKCIQKIVKPSPRSLRSSSWEALTVSVCRCVWFCWRRTQNPIMMRSQQGPCLFFFSDITWAACSISSSMKTHLTGTRSPKILQAHFQQTNALFITFLDFLNRFKSTQWAASRDESKHAPF